MCAKSVRIYIQCKKLVRALVCDYLSHTCRPHGQSEKLLALSSRRALLRFRPKQLGFKFQNDDPVDAFCRLESIRASAGCRFFKRAVFLYAQILPMINISINILTKFLSIKKSDFFIYQCIKYKEESRECIIVLQLIENLLTGLL